MSIPDLEGRVARAYREYVCPECGRDLRTVDPLKHAIGHWPDELPPYTTHDQARIRKAALLELAQIGGPVKDR